MGIPPNSHPTSGCTDPAWHCHWPLLLFPLVFKRDSSNSAPSGLEGNGRGKQEAGEGGRKEQVEGSTMGPGCRQKLVPQAAPPPPLVLSLLEARKPPGVSQSCLMVSPLPSGPSTTPTGPARAPMPCCCFRWSPEAPGRRRSICASWLYPLF